MVEGLEYVLSGLALVVAIWAARLSLKAEREAVNHGSVSDIFGEFRRLTELRLANWQHTHILEPPENYESTKELVRDAVGSLSDGERARYQLQERAVALAIFQLFEQVLYQRSEAERVGDQPRKDFLQDVADYMTGRLFRNPRLLYLWSEAGGNLRADFEPSTREYYERGVGADVVIPESGLHPL